MESFELFQFAYFEGQINLTRRFSSVGFKIFCNHFQPPPSWLVFGVDS